MLNDDVLTNALHRIQLFVPALSHEVDLSESTVANDAQRFEVFECGVDEGVLAP